MSDTVKSSLQQAIEFLRARNRTGVLQCASDHCLAVDTIIKAYDSQEFALCFTRADAIRVVEEAVRHSDITLDFCADGILANTEDYDLPVSVTPEEADKLLARMPYPNLVKETAMNTCPTCHGPMTPHGCLHRRMLALRQDRGRPDR